MGGILNLLLAGAASVVKDAYFNLVTLLLNTTSTNGAQNNTFLDSSTNNFSITRNGNATQGTFTPFSQTGWGVYNTIGSYCQLNNSDYSISTGDFTIEFWMYCVDDSSYSVACFASATSNPNLTVAMGSGSSGARLPYLEFGGGGTFFSAFSNYLNKWTHVAFVRSGGTCTVYQNGTALSSASKSAAVGNTANLYLLRNSGDANQDFRGYISNFRICKSAVYTGNFTPATTNFTTTSQGATSCQLLTFQNNRFLDNSSNASTVTPTTTSIQAFSPFAPTTAYDTAVVGGSGYFDGSGDYLTFAPGSSFAFGTGDFTIEQWFYPPSTLPTYAYLLDARNSGQTANWATGFNLNNTGTGQFTFFDGVAATAYNEPTVSYKPAAWNHCVVVRSGTTLSMYMNGVRVYTTTNSTNFSTSPTLSYIGRGHATGSEFYFPGYMSSIRIVKGTAVYSPSSTTLTVPTAPLTAVSGTSLLTNFTNAGIYDSAAKNVSETVGTAQVSTTQAKFGTTSMKFDGSSSSWLFIPFSRNLDISTGSPDWTLECWAYIVSYSNSPYLFNKGGVAATYYTNYSIVIPSSGVAYLALGNNGGETGYNFGSVSTNTWYHFAATRQGNTIRTFLNGTLVTNTTIGTAMTDNGEGLYIGVLKNLTTNVLNGYIDDLRITKGYARYTATFTPPSSAFPIQ